MQEQNIQPVNVKKGQKFKFKTISILPSDFAVIEEGARRLGLSTTAFFKSCALEKSIKILRDCAVIQGGQNG